MNQLKQQNQELQKLSQNQKNFQKFVKENNIQQTLQDMLHTMSHNQIDDPNIFMIQFLCQYKVQPKTLTENGIFVRSININDTIENYIINQDQQQQNQQNQQQQQQNTNKTPFQIAQKFENCYNIELPSLTENIQNIFKNIFYRNNKENFITCKDRSTDLKNTLRPIIQAGIQNTDKKVGVYACDTYAYKVFQPLFLDAIQEIHYPKDYAKFENQFIKNTLQNQTKRKKNNDTDYFQSIKNKKYDQNISKYTHFIKSTDIKIKRNFANFCYNIALKSNERKQLSDVMKGQLKDVGIISQELNSICKLEKDKIIEKYNLPSILKQSDISGIIGQESLRFNDWPKHRLVGETKDKQIIAIGNREDHLELRSKLTSNQEIFKRLCEMLEILKKIDQKLFVNFSFDQDFGYTTVKPQYLGLGIVIKMLIEIPQNELSVFLKNQKQLPIEITEVFIIIPTKTNNQFIVKNKNTLFETEITFMEKINTIIETLFQNISSDGDKMEEELLVENKHSQGIQWDYLKKNNFVVDSECYQVFEKEICEHFEIKNNQPKNYFGKDHFIIQIEDKYVDDKQQQQEQIEYKLQHIIEKQEQLKNNNQNIIIQSHGIVESSYLVLRRNLVGFPLKPKMKKDDFEQVDKICKSFIDKIFDSDEYHNNKSHVYQQKARHFLLQNNLIDHQSYNNLQNDDEYSLGTQLYLSKNGKLKIIVNYEDHLIFVYQITQNKISRDMADLLAFQESFIKNLSDLIPQNFIQEPFIFDEQYFGYHTVNPKFSGSGLSCVYMIREKLGDEAKEQNFESTSCIEQDIKVHQSHIQKELSTRFQINSLTNNKLSAYINFCNQNINEAKKNYLEEKIYKQNIILDESLLEVESLNNKSNCYSILDCLHDNLFNIQIHDEQHYKLFSNFYKHYIENSYTLLERQINQNFEQYQQQQYYQQQSQLQDDFLFNNNNININQNDSQKRKDCLEQNKMGYNTFQSTKLIQKQSIMWDPLLNKNSKCPNLKLKIKIEIHRNFEGVPLPDFMDYTSLQQFQNKLVQKLINKFPGLEEKQQIDALHDRLLPEFLKKSKDIINKNKQQPPTNLAEYKQFKNSQILYNGIVNCIGMRCLVNHDKNFAIWFGLDNTHIIIVHKFVENEHSVQKNHSNMLFSQVLEYLSSQNKYLYSDQIGFIQNYKLGDGLTIKVNLEFPKQYSKKIEQLCQESAFELIIKKTVREGHSYRAKIKQDEQLSLLYLWKIQVENFHNIFDKIQKNILNQ